MNDKKERIDLQAGHAGYLDNQPEPPEAHEALIPWLRAKCTTIPALLAAVDRLIDRYLTPPRNWADESLRSRLRRKSDTITWTRGDEGEQIRDTDCGWQRIYRVIYNHTWALRRPDMKELPRLEDDAYRGMVDIRNWLAANVRAEQPEANGREKPWADVTPGFILISEARTKHCDGPNVPTVGTLGKTHCRPDGEFDYMRKGQRRKVHEEQFAAYAERQGWTRAAVRKADALREAYKNSPQGRQEALRKQWKPEYPDSE